jgi:small subunit ribosomal protein S20
VNNKDIIIQLIDRYLNIFIKKMNKKQKNRKLVTQNKRNRIINRRYTSTIKTLFKLFTFKIKNINTDSIKNVSQLPQDQEIYINQKKGIVSLVNNLYSVIDKAIKKKVIHKNTAARKKSRIGKFVSKI